MTGVKNRAASIRARLLNQARASGSDFNLLLTKYGLERFLYRLSVSDWRDQFLLKGALLFDLWFDQPARPTRDIDLLGFGVAGLDDLAAVFRRVCAQPCDDAIIFDPVSVSAVEIRKQTNYAGVRVLLTGELDRASCPVQIDIGFGDAVTPAAQSVIFPVLLGDMPPPNLRAYPVYTVIAEKYHAIVTLGMTNTRMKDYFDLWFLAQNGALDGVTLVQAIAATFARRDTPIPLTLPIGLSAAFASDGTKQRQWNAFLSKNGLNAPGLGDVVLVLIALLVPPSLL